MSGDSPSGACGIGRVRGRAPVAMTPNTTPPLDAGTAVSGYLVGTCPAVRQFLFKVENLLFVFTNTSGDNNTNNEKK